MADRADDPRAEELAQVFIEQMEDRFAVLQENLDAMLDQKLQPLQTDLHDLKGDVRVIKAVVTDQSKQLKDHEVRLASGEEAAA